MARLETWYKQDLKRPLVVHKHTDVFNQDSKGNLIGVEVYSDGEPVVLAGSISGYCLLADGTTVPAVGASRSGNKASVLIPQTAYSVPGPITITIKNVDGDNIATLCATVGVVRQSVSGSLVNPGSVVTDWSNNINAQLQAVQTAADNVGAIVAAPFDENTVYVVGNYVTNNGNLYRITADHASGIAWADTAKVQCTVGSELSELKSAIGEKQITISTTESSPCTGYWSRNLTTGIVALNTPDDFYMTLEQPIDISSLNPGVEVSFLASITGSSGAFITDENYHLLDYVNGGNAEEKGYTVTSTPQIVTLEVPKGAKYIMADIRSAYYTGLSDFDVTVYDNSVNELLNRMDEAESDINTIDGRVGTIENEIGGGEITITPQLSERKNGYYARQISSNRMVYAESTTYFTVEPIDISKLVAGTQVKMQASVNSAYGIFITDSGLNVLDYVNGSNAEAKGYSPTSKPQLVTLTVPANAKYITSDIRTSYFTDMSIFAVVGTRKDNITLMQDEVNGLSVNGNVLSGKKWVACGDSFTAGSFGYSLTDNYIFEDGLYAGNKKVYPYWIGRRNPFMEVVNEAISGSTMTGGESGVNPFSGTRYTSIPDDADYITLMFGINDSGNACPIGTIDDSDNTTFYGAWNVVLGYFMEHFPFAHIGIIIGPGMQTSSGQNYANAEIAIAKKWGIPYLNIQFESGGGKIPLMLRTNNPDVSQAVKSACNERQFVNPSTETPNYHPNEDAHEFESTFIEAWLRTL